jgi:hypothetical protein
MGANVSVARITTIASQGAAYNTIIPSGKLPRSALVALGEMGYGQSDDRIINFCETKTQAEEYHRRVLEIIRAKVPKKERSGVSMELSPSRVNRMQAVVM